MECGCGAPYISTRLDTYMRHSVVLCSCIYICMYICMYTCICTYVLTYRSCIQTYLHTYIYMHAYRNDSGFPHVQKVAQDLQVAQTTAASRPLLVPLSNGNLSVCLSFGLSVFFLYIYLSVCVFVCPYLFNDGWIYQIRLLGLSVCLSAVRLHVQH
jgi:hypothetical protein